MFNAILVWVKSKKVFLKIQLGTGDNLTEEDFEKGFESYCLWSLFKPECIDMDGELSMECFDSGMTLFKSAPNFETVLETCYSVAFNEEYNETNVVELYKE